MQDNVTVVVRIIDTGAPPSIPSHVYALSEGPPAGRVLDYNIGAPTLNGMSELLALRFCASFGDSLTFACRIPRSIFDYRDYPCWCKPFYTTVKWNPSCYRVHCVPICRNVCSACNALPPFSLFVVWQVQLDRERQFSDWLTERWHPACEHFTGSVDAGRFEPGSSSAVWHENDDGHFAPRTSMLWRTLPLEL